jgi:hypothetical protein
VAAYGGETRWRAASEVVAEISVGGWALRSKGRSPLRRIRVRAGVWNPVIRIEPFGGSDRAAILEGHDARIEDAAGKVADSRINAGRSFTGLRHRLWWDELDKIYFVANLLWNTLTLPANVVVAHDSWGEIPYPASTRVTPRAADGTPRRSPVLVDIDVHAWELHD